MESAGEKIPGNTVVVDLETGYTKRGELNLPKESIRNGARILTNALLEYARAGGDMDELTPDKVFAKKKTD